MKRNDTTAKTLFFHRQAEKSFVFLQKNLQKSTFCRIVKNSNKNLLSKYNKLLFFFILYLNSIFCNISFIKSPLDKENSDSYRVCFWNVANLSVKELKKEKKGTYIIKFINSCDIISFQEVNAPDENIAIVFEDRLEKLGEPFICMEGNSKPKNDSNGFKYVSCIRAELSNDIEKIEFEDINPAFKNAPTLFLMTLNDIKVLIAPYHSTPGSKSDLIAFNSVVDFAYKNFSDRRIFFGGDFNTDKKYQSIDFLFSISYFIILKQMINGITTLNNEKNDLILTDPRTAMNCKGTIWKLNEIYPEIAVKKDLENISTHYPISVDCLFK